MREFLLGLIQGLTEFLPVSSSGHLVLSEKILGVNFKGLNFEIFLHFATLSVAIVFLWEYIMYIFSSKEKFLKYLKLLFIASLPSGIIGILFKNFFENIGKNHFYVLFFLVINGVLMLLASNFKSKGETSINEKQAFWMGIAQVFAIFPGLSRSGLTTSVGVWLGLDFKEALRFSFLMMIIAVGGATLLELKGIIHNLNFSTAINGVLGAVVGGIIALYLLLKRNFSHKEIYLYSGLWCVGIILFYVLRF